MSAQTAPYSPDFQNFLQLVDESLVQAAEDARELAERTGTPLVVRDAQGSKGSDRISNDSSNPLEDANFSAPGVVSK